MQEIYPFEIEISSPSDFFGKNHIYLLFQKLTTLRSTGTTTNSTSWTEWVSRWGPSSWESQSRAGDPTSHPQIRNSGKQTPQRGGDSCPSSWWWSASPQPPPPPVASSSWWSSIASWNSSSTKGSLFYPAQKCVRFTIRFPFFLLIRLLILIGFVPSINGT